MKTATSIARPPGKTREGSAVFIILVLLTIMAVLIAANNVALNRLRHQLKIVDQRQTQRLASSSTHQPISK